MYLGPLHSNALVPTKKIIVDSVWTTSTSPCWRQDRELVILKVTTFDYNYQKPFLFFFFLTYWSILLRLKKKTESLLFAGNNKLKHSGSCKTIASSCNCPIQRVTRSAWRAFFRAVSRPRAIGIGDETSHSAGKISTSCIDCGGVATRTAVRTDGAEQMSTEKNWVGLTCKMCVPLEHF